MAATVDGIEAFTITELKGQARPAASAPSSTSAPRPDSPISESLPRSKSTSCTASRPDPKPPS